MFKVSASLIISVALTGLASSPVFAIDARSAALGGSAIANGKGVHGALENPSSLMRMQRDGQRFHFHLGVSVDIQDDAGIIETAQDQESLPDDIEFEIDALSGRTLTCDLSSNPETVCLTGTRRLGNLSAGVLDILTGIDNTPIQATAAADFGVAYTKSPIPIALHYRASVTGAGKTILADGDTDYLNTFATVLADNELTFNELSQSVPLSISSDGQTLTVLQPEEVLESDVEGSALIREQLGLGLATSVQISGFNVDLGITPKFSELRASSLKTKLGNRFDDDEDTISDQFENNEVVDTAFNIDFGASTRLNQFPIQLSVVARNLLKESITTKENFEFETTPQLIVGAAYSLSALTISGDLALNKAKLDNLETQIIAVGIEWSQALFGLRAGISHDNARTASATALSLGFSLGPLHVGARATELESAQMGVQLAFSF